MGLYFSVDNPSKRIANQMQKYEAAAKEHAHRLTLYSNQRFKIAVLNYWMLLLLR
jgi:hypothetical protein